MTGRTATDAELADFARFLARLTLEIERSLRDAEQLRTLMSPDGWQQWQRSRPPGAFRGGPVAKTDIGPPRIQRLDAKRALANVTTRTDPERWGALTMQLDATRGRWTAVSMQRLYAARHYRTGPRTPVVPVPIGEQIAATRQLRDQAAAALHAVQLRTGELPKTSDARPQLEELSTTWSNLVADLDRQLATLTRQVQTGQQVQRQLRRLR